MSEIRVYSVDEAARILQVTRRTLYSYIKAKKLHAVKIGKYWRVTPENLQNFIETGTPVLETNRRKENQGKAG